MTQLDDCRCGSHHLTTIYNANYEVGGLEVSIKCDLCHNQTASLMTDMEGVSIYEAVWERWNAAQKQPFIEQ